MNIDTLIGSVMIVGALLVILVLTLWSRKSINWIAENKDPDLRDILKERENGK